MHSYSEIKPELLERLKKIEGQMRGLQRMIDQDRYCIDVLTQLAAVTQGVRRVTRMVTEAHARGCVTHAMQAGSGEEAVEELINVIFKFVK
ncbi:MAG: metal-sensitive transcriptional regulator [Bacillota bacterium]